MELHDWLTANADRFIGALKINEEKRPLKGETKNDNWLFSDDNLPADRMASVIEFDKESDDHSIGVLVPNDILVIDLDNKVGGIDGVKRWAALSDIPISYKSSSGRGAHIWVKSPFNGTIKSTYAKVSKVKADKAIELFSGHKQYIKLPDNGFNWGNLDLDNLPELPEGFLKGVVPLVDACDIDKTAKVAKLELDSKYPLHQLHHYLMGIPAPRDYADFFKLTSCMYALAYYQEHVNGDKPLAVLIKKLWDHKNKEAKEYNRFTNMNQWDAMAYLGSEGMGLGYLTYNSTWGKFPSCTRKQSLARKLSFRNIVDAKELDENHVPEAPARVLPFSIM